MEKIIKISKLDGAKRQLETAVRLYFSTGDPVSIHTLTCAAYNVIRDINKARKGPPMLIKDQLKEKIKPEYKELWSGKINEAENFFKHADKDPESALDFNPDQTDMLILDACTQYYKLTGEDPPLFKQLRAWYVVNNQELFNFSEEEKGRIESFGKDAIGLGRERFFSLTIPQIMKISI